MNEKKYIELGVCKSPHGIKGGFSFFLHNPEDSVLEDDSEVLLVPLDKTSSLPKEGQSFLVSQISFGNKVIAYLKGVDDRTTAESMIPFSIQFSRDDFPELTDGEYYLTDLIGSTVFDYKTKNKVGMLDSFYENGPQLIAVVRGEESFELPFIEAFFPVIDQDNKRIEMIVPDYIDG